MTKHILAQFAQGRPQAGDRRWYTVRAADNGEPAEILIYDEIGRGFFGGGIAAEDFVAELKALNLKAGDKLRVRINSPGGDLFDGNTIYNYMTSLNLDIYVRIDGVAASAASIIAMAGRTINMPENSFLMIHNPWTIGIGDEHDFRKLADDLHIMRKGAIATYKRRVGDSLTEDEIIGMLDEATWLTAQEAVDKGFADEVDEPVRAAALARFDLNQYGLPHIPDRIQQASASDLAERRSRLEALRASAH